MTVWRFEKIRSKARTSVEASNLEAARQEAIQRIRALLNEEQAAGEPVDLDRSIDITNEAGHVLTTVLFSEAVRA